MICKDCANATDLELGTDGPWSAMTELKIRFTINGHRRCARKQGKNNKKKGCDCQHRGWL